MTLPRSHLIEPGAPGHFHIVSRCVRRSFLCGRDPLSGNDYSHRKQWILNRVAQLAPSYALDVNGYAVMSNHFHLAVYIDPRATLEWSPEEVAERWLRAYPPGALDGDASSKIEEERARMLANSELLEQRRSQLGSLSHFMKGLKQPIARRANLEDGCTGHFFEGRFFSGALLDAAAIIECLAYIDLNPVRAGIARSLKECELTSIVERIRQAEEAEHEQSQAIAPVFTGLKPGSGGLEKAGIQVTCRDYLALCQAKCSTSGRRESFEYFRRRQRAYGTADSLRRYKSHVGLQRLRAMALPD